MAQIGCRWVQGFEETSTLSQRWESPGGWSISTTNPRTGASCIRNTGGTPGFKNIPGVDPATSEALSFVVAGFALNFNGGVPSTNASVILFRDSGSANQVEVQVNSSYQFRITRNGTALTSYSTLSAPSNGYFYLEFKAQIGSGTSGSAEVRINQVSAVSVANANTQGSTGNTVTQITLGGLNLTFDADDMYIADDDFHGDLRMQTLFVNGAGTYAEWTPNAAGTNFSKVNEHPPDDNTTYVSAGAPNSGERDTYATAGVSFTGSIEAVQQAIRAEKDDASVQQYQHMVRSGGNDFFGVPVQNLALGTYNYADKVWNTDPNTGLKWTQANFNSAEWGQKHNFPILTDSIVLSDGTPTVATGASMTINIH